MEIIKTLFLICLLVGCVSAEQITVKERYITGGDVYFTLVIEDISGNFYYWSSHNMWSKGLTEDMMLMANKYLPNTTHDVKIDSFNRIR
jgi:hypothetical protein